MTSTIDSAVETIRRLVQDELGPGDRLPSEQELVDEIGVSRATVREALARLATDGLVEKRWGVGTFVAETRPRTALGMLSVKAGLPAILASAGGTPSVAHFEAEERPADADLFPDFPSAPTFWIVRVFALDGVPAIAIRDRVVRDFDGNHLDPSRLQSADVIMADVLADAGIDFTFLEVELWADLLDAEGRSLFELSKPEPVLQTRGMGFDASGRRILSARATYRTRIVRVRLTAT